jgi:hypothetical protein
MTLQRFALAELARERGEIDNNRKPHNHRQSGHVEFYPGRPRHSCVVDECARLGSRVEQDVAVYVRPGVARDRPLGAEWAADARAVVAALHGPDERTWACEYRLRRQPAGSQAYRSHLLLYLVTRGPEKAGGIGHRLTRPASSTPDAQHHPQRHLLHGANGSTP